MQAQVQIFYDNITDPGCEGWTWWVDENLCAAGNFVSRDDAMADARQRFYDPALGAVPISIAFEGGCGVSL